MDVYKFLQWTYHTPLLSRMPVMFDVSIYHILSMHTQKYAFYLIMTRLWMKIYCSHIHQKHPWPITNAILPSISDSFNSLCRVLFIFPLRYLFTISFLPIFSLECLKNLVETTPPLSCSIKQLYSSHNHFLLSSLTRILHLTPAWCPFILYSSYKLTHIGDYHPPW